MQGNAEKKIFSPSTSLTTTASARATTWNALQCGTGVVCDDVNSKHASHGAHWCTREVYCTATTTETSVNAKHVNNVELRTSRKKEVIETREDENNFEKRILNKKVSGYIIDLENNEVTSQGKRDVVNNVLEVQNNDGKRDAANNNNNGVKKSRGCCSKNGISIHKEEINNSNENDRSMQQDCYRKPLSNGELLSNCTNDQDWNNIFGYESFNQYLINNKKKCISGKRTSIMDNFPSYDTRQANNSGLLIGLLNEPCGKSNGFPSFSFMSNTLTKFTSLHHAIMTDISQTSKSNSTFRVSKFRRNLLSFLVILFTFSVTTAFTIADNKISFRTSSPQPQVKEIKTYFNDQIIISQHSGQIKSEVEESKVKLNNVLFPSFQRNLKQIQKTSTKSKRDSKAFKYSDEPLTNFVVNAIAPIKNTEPNDTNSEKNGPILTTFLKHKIPRQKRTLKSIETVYPMSHLSLITHNSSINKTKNPSYAKSHQVIRYFDSISIGLNPYYKQKPSNDDSEFNRTKKKSFDIFETSRYQRIITINESNMNNDNNMNENRNTSTYLHGIPFINSTAHNRNIVKEIKPDNEIPENIDPRSNQRIEYITQIKHKQTFPEFHDNSDLQNSGKYPARDDLSEDYLTQEELAHDHLAHDQLPAESNQGVLQNDDSSIFHTIGHYTIEEQPKPEQQYSKSAIDHFFDRYKQFLRTPVIMPTVSILSGFFFLSWRKKRD